MLFLEFSDFYYGYLHIILLVIEILFYDLFGGFILAVYIDLLVYIIFCNKVILRLDIN
jgi:hypothetical protein